MAEAVSGPCNRVSWKKVSGASGYHIYRKLQGKSWVRIGTVNNKVLSWQDTKIEGITSYAYAVRPYKNVDGKKVLGGYQASSYILSYPELQKISSVRKTSRGLKICWKAQKKADCYQIYRKTGKGSWKKISTVSGGSRSSFEDKTAKKGTTYCGRILLDNRKNLRWKSTLRRICRKSSKEIKVLKYKTPGSGLKHSRSGRFMFWLNMCIIYDYIRQFKRKISRC